MIQPSPNENQERMLSLDILRGLAIFGILLVNMKMMNTPYIYLELTGIQLWEDGLNQFISTFISIFAQGKFYTMFSFLFGVGFMIFLERAAEKNHKPVRLFIRRMIILFGIGMIHALLIWWGDILMMYAIGGLFLLFFYKTTPKTKIIWAFALLLFYVFLISILVGLSTLDQMTASESLRYDKQVQIEAYKQEIENSMYAYGQGAFKEVMSQRIKDVTFMIPNNISAFLLFMPMFLFGAYAGQQKMFQNIPQHIGFIRKVWFSTMLIGIPFSIVKYWSANQLEPLTFNIYTNLEAVGSAFGDGALSLFYITTIILIIQLPTWRKRLTPLAYVGRTAISNYLLQSILCTLLFYSYGLGLYGQVSPLWGLVLTLFIFAIQLISSKRWLQTFRIGPVEWLWRSITYGKIQPFKP